MTEMTQLNRMIQQNILEHESRLKHVDELLERAQQKMANEEDVAEQLAKAKQARDKLSSQVEAFKVRPPDQCFQPLDQFFKFLRQRIPYHHGAGLLEFRFRPAFLLLMPVRRLGCQARQ